MNRVEVRDEHFAAEIVLRDRFLVEVAQEWEGGGGEVEKCWKTWIKIWAFIVFSSIGFPFSLFAVKFLRFF